MSVFHDGMPSLLLDVPKRTARWLRAAVCIQQAHAASAQAKLGLI